MRRDTFLTVVIILLIAVTVIPCFGHAFYYDNFNTMSPSASTIGRGGYISGGAHIWSQNPLEYWDNPAKLGYAKGFAYGHHTHEYKDWPASRRAACATFGWNGIGIMVPALNDYGRFGHSIDYDSEFYDETPYEDTERYAIGVNLFDAIFDRNGHGIRNRFLSEISFGATLQRYMFDWGEYTHVTEQSSVNIGSLIRMTPIDWTNSDYSLDVVAGLNWTNITKEKVTVRLIGDGNYFMYDYPLLYGMKYSLAAKGSYRPVNMLSTMNRDFFDEILSMALTLDHYDFGFSEDDEDWSSIGLELGVMDIFYFRMGNMHLVYENHPDSDWFTYGFGIKVDYRNTFEFQWNYADSETDLDNFTMYDFMLRINFLELGNLKQ